MFSDISKVLLITDLDGTLLPSSKVLSQSDINSIKKFTQQGGKFSIATGRPIQSVSQYFDELDITTPIILYNGSMIYDSIINKVVWQKCLPNMARAVVKSVLNVFPSASAEILTADGIFSLQINDIERRHIEISRTNPKECTLDEVPDGWLKFLFALEPELIPELKNFLDGLNFNEAEYVQSCRHFYEVLPKGTSKGTALRKLRLLCEFENYTIVAVGDYNNDIEMIKYADIGIATENALPAVKNAADIVLDVSCENNAISKVIEYIFSQTIITSKT